MGGWHRVLLGLAAVAPSQSASAWCTSSSRANLWAGDQIPVPVYVNWADPGVGLVNLAYTDPSFDQDSALAYVEGAIAQINEGAHGDEVPPLYFAGFIDGDTTTADNRPDRSIVIHTTGCALLPGCGDGIACTSASADRFRIDLLAGGTRACGGGNMAWTVLPSDDPGQPDLQGTVTHELLHALGLGHSNDTTCGDQPGWSIWPVPDGSDVDNAVMGVPGADNSDYGTSWYRLRRRTLQQADLFGLRDAYVSTAGIPLLHESTDGVNWTSVDPPEGMYTYGNFVLSSASGPDSELMVGAWSNLISHIAWSVRSFDGTWSEVHGCSAPGTVDCDTRHPPATAVMFSGREHYYFVGWTSQDSDDDSHAALRFEIVNASTDTVMADETYLWHFDHYSRAMGAGVNVDQSEFIVAALSDYNVLVLQSFDLQGNLTDARGYSGDVGGRPHHVGNPVCLESLGRGQMRCVVPVTTNDIGGTCAAYFAFEHGPSGFSAATELESDCDVQIPGRPQLAVGWGGPIRAMLSGAEAGAGIGPYRLWSLGDPHKVELGVHVSVPLITGADLYRSVGSQSSGGTTSWLVSDGVYTP